MKDVNFIAFSSSRSKVHWFLYVNGEEQVGTLGSDDIKEFVETCVDFCGNLDCVYLIGTIKAIRLIARTCKSLDLPVVQLQYVEIKDIEMKTNIIKDRKLNKLVTCVKSKYLKLPDEVEVLSSIEKFCIGGL